MELRREFGWTEYHLDKLVQSGLPYVQQANRGKGISWLFDKDEVEQWIDQYEDETGSSVPGSQEYEAARTRKMSAQADLAEHQLAVKRKEVVPIDVVCEIVGRQYAAMRAHLLSIPSRLKPLIGAENEGLFSEAINEALQELQDERIEDMVFGHDK